MAWTYKKYVNNQPKPVRHFLSLVMETRVIRNVNHWDLLFVKKGGMREVVLVLPNGQMIPEKVVMVAGCPTTIRYVVVQMIRVFDGRIRYWLQKKCDLILYY